MGRINNRSNGASQKFWELVSKFTIDNAAVIRPDQGVILLKSLAAVGRLTEDIQKVEENDL